MPTRILLVDDDPLVHELVQRTLEKDGFAIEGAFDGEQGLQRALEICPDLIISDVLMPEMDGWTFVQKIRSHKEMMLVPVIFLTALSESKHRFLGFRIGADDYCTKPFELDDLRSRVKRLLSRGKHTKRHFDKMRDHEESVGLGGSLVQMSVSTILTILEMEKKSGVFVIKGEMEGRMFLCNGKVVDAHLEEGNLTGVDAVYLMLSWSVGEFKFFSKSIDNEDVIGLDTPFLLMEAARRADDLGRGD